MRTSTPSSEGRLERAGVGLHYEVHGEGARTVFLLPTWSIVHSEMWKFQVADLSRNHRVLVMDGRGNGRSDRPATPESYAELEFTDDALAVMDETKTEKATIVSLSAGARWALRLAADHPERVEGAVFIGPALPISNPIAGRGDAVNAWKEERESYEGWEKYNKHYWLSHHADFLEFFFAEVINEPHSTKHVEDMVRWGRDTTGEVLVATEEAPGLTRDETLELISRVTCPVLVVHGTADAIIPFERGELLAAGTGGRLVAFEGSGHAPHARDPVRFNLLLRDFLGERPAPKRWAHALARPKRALYISSPIGLGHARRDLAIARELRALVPGLEIDWLAQHPVTTVLTAAGETVHAGSAQLASESRHIELESGEHELNVFQALRSMDEVLLHNFMVFNDVVRDEQYDLWIGDEAWDVDHFLHENPELKTASFAWLSDFVGLLPMPEGGDQEAALTADYNAEMIEHIARYPHLRDISVFVGEPADIVPGTFGTGLPNIREWTEAHFRFSGYVLGFDPADLGDRAALRRELGYAESERVCIVTVGGSGVGESLLRRIVAAHDVAAASIDGLRMIVVTGPRIEPKPFQRSGVEVRTFVPDLHRHLAACDIALVQGGLTTCMELAAARTPFLYFPLRHHFEQNLHVDHRLRRYRAGRRMDYQNATPAAIAEAMVAELARPARTCRVDPGGARRAAGMLATLL